MTEKIAEKLFKGGSKLRERVFKNCPYGEKHFCNGKVNRTIKCKGEKRSDKDPCKFFIKGKCRNPEVRI